MSLQKIALFVLLAACAQPAYSGYGAAGGASSAPVALPTDLATRAAPGAPSAAFSGSVTKRPPPAAMPPRPGSLTTSPRAVPVLVIPAKEMDAATYGRVVEDLNVMNRIIDKSLRDLSDEGYGFTTTGIQVYGQRLSLPFDSPGPWILRSPGGRPRAIYVGGYGAVFSLQVDFPLVPPPEAPEPNKAAEKGDQVWAAAQRELASPPATFPVRPGVPQGRPYRAEAVETLRSGLIALLKHATNIRDLEPESWLTILVQGSGTMQEHPEELSSDQQSLLILGSRPTGISLLSLRAKKADIDQFAKGQLGQTQFQQRVQIVTR